MTTYSAKPSEIERKWYVIDAEDLVLGRLASKASMILRGKHKPTYTPSIDCGDHVIIINAEKVYLTGKKYEGKKYFWHTGYPGGIKERNVRKTIEGKYPERVVGKAIERMISRSPLGREQMSKLHIYKGSEHPHAGQKPEILDFGSQNRKNKKSEAA
ncbi:MAG: 50S ribosomal protein L13 [Alphaproteobacteria bacterium CG11_big_fil_rev_8_21_14_0_20_39_49]|nr:MAG: 50S ribosomal protein L13 [Alphaproteobacteria bacterium CG11_big_fil_rev_8_21_14_0_20_39_49]